MTRTVILGTEFDEPLRRILAEVMRELGARTLDTGWGVGGSQELATAKIEIRGKVVDVESETYVGLSITGDEDLIDEIARRVSRNRQ
jgi:hypothetical protein